VNKPLCWFGAVLVVLGWVAVTPGRAAETDTRRYTLADHGSLQLQVPTGWKEELQQEHEQLLPTLVFTPTAGAPFGIVLTPLWPTEKDAPHPEPDALQRLVQHAAEEVRAVAAEPMIEILELTGTAGVGYYFSVTDPAPKPGDYKHMTQGILPVGILLLPFTIYTNDGQQDIVTAALTMLKSATHSYAK
jgi:hypothetical protein